VFTVTVLLSTQYGTCEREFVDVPSRPQTGECLRIGARLVRVVKIVHHVAEPSISEWNDEPELNRDFGAEILAVPFVESEVAQ
jgi:hypothetical protein